jgi:small conductance mechanosensitive channel
MEELRASISGWLNPQFVGELLIAWGGRIVGALAIFLIGRLVVAALSRWLVSAMQRVGMDQTLARFFGNFSYIGLMVFVVLSAVNTLGVPTTNFVAIVGAAGLAIGLALKDSLSNFSSGVMLVFFRPFKVGDAINAAGVAGTVDAIGMFSTTVKTPDNSVVTVPNSLIYSGTITNMTAEVERRISFTISISYEDDLLDAKQMIRDIVESDRRVRKAPAPDVLVQDLLPNGVSLAVNAWVATGDFGATRSDLLERIRVAMADRGFSVPHERVRLLERAAQVE